MTHRFIYLFDPLCGWCYGASAGVDTLASRPGVSVELLPTGLFSGAGARALDAGMTSHIWAADQRIAELTGAAFTERYHDRVLAGVGPWIAARRRSPSQRYPSRRPLANTRR